MRQQLMLSAAMALAANKDAGNSNKPADAPQANADQTQTEEAKVLEAFTFKEVNSTNVKSIAQAVWARIEVRDKDGKDISTHGNRSDVMQEFVSALRDARDADENKVTRPKKSLEDIIKESIGKPMGDLQAAKIPLIGVPINFPQLIKIATSVAEEGKPDHPLKAEAVKFMKQHKLTVIQKKTDGSRGRKVTFLVEAGPENGTIDKLAA